jgi:hypothetical protein
MYKKTLTSGFLFGQPIEEGKMVIRILDNAYIPFDPANTDYQTFKAQINADEAQLEDADGNVMSAEEAKAYVATLP